MKHRFWGRREQRVSHCPLLSHPFLAANEKDFSLSLEMTNAGKRHSRIESHLYEEFVKRPSTSFPWKEVARRDGGWLSQRDESQGRGAFSLVTPSHLCYNT